MRFFQKFCLVFILVLVLSGLQGTMAATVLLNPFESTDGLSIKGQNNGTATMAVVSEPVKSGEKSLRLDYNLPPGNYSYSNAELVLNKPLPAVFGKIGLWIYGNLSNNRILMRVEDSTGEVFQYRLGELNWGPEWKWLEMDLSGFYTRWGGNGNGVIEGPAKLQSFLIEGAPFVADTVYFDELTYIAAGVGIITGRVLDQLTQYPISGLKVFLSEDPAVASRTDNNGVFVLYVLPGSYNLVIGGGSYEQKSIPVTIAVDEELPITCFLYPAPDTGVYSDKANNDEHGLTLLSGIHSESWKGEIVEIGGRKAVRLNRSLNTNYLFYDIADDYIYGGNNQVYITIEYFDNGTGLIGLQYDSPSATAKVAGTITRKNTRTWKEATIFIPDGIFANRNGGVPGDFRLGIWIPGYEFQEDAYIGKVSIVKQGRVASVEVTPAVISPVKGGIVTIKYRLTSVGIVSAWVEDAKGNRVISLGEEREGSEGYFTWAGMDQNGNPVPDGLYYIKLASSGIAWGGTSEFTYLVEVLTKKPKRPYLEEKGTIKVNEPQVLVTGRASPGAKVRVYLNGSEQAESIADAQGRVSFVVEQLAPGENTVYIAELDQAGNESDPSDSLLVLYDAAAVIVGQITLSQREFAPPAEITIRFFVTDTRTLVVRATDGKKSVTIGELTDVSGLQTLNWSGMVDETPLPDGEYLIEIFEGTTKLAWTTVIISTAEPRKPLLLIPRNNGNLSSGKVRFSWEGSEAASFYRLRVWDGQTEFVYETYLTFFQLQDTLLPGVWNWQVEAVTEAGTSSFSEVGSFVINPELPAVLEVCNVQGGPNPFSPNGNGRYEQFHLSYSLTQDAMVDIIIYNLAGFEVYRRGERPEMAGDHVFVWDGRDRRGRVVARGSYVLLILARNEQNRAPGGARKLINVIY